MGKRVITVLLIIVVVGAVFIGGWMYLKKSSGKISRLPPKELSTSFDPSVNSAVFTVDSVDKEKKVLNLKFVWPKNFEGIKVQSRINCGEGDIFIHSDITEDKSSAESVSLDALFARLGELKTAQLLFSGICSDTTCIEMTNLCRLFVYE